MSKREFQIVRFNFYIVLVITYFYLLLFADLDCHGCLLCGMTRAIKSILLFDFKNAFLLNKYSWIFIVLIPVIIIDIINIMKKNFKLTKR